MAEDLVRIEGVRHRFARSGGGPDVIALDGIDTTIAAGTMTGLVGPDAAGKTTLLRLIAGLLRPSEGRIIALGHDMARAAERAHADIGYMPQRFGLYEDLSVAENLSLFADLHAIPTAERDERIARLLRFTALAPFIARRAGQLSGGMKQKLGLACALLARPRLLLLDEPSVGVDPASRRELWTIVTAMLAEGHGDGMAAIWATAYLDEAARCDRVLLLHEGRLLSEAPPNDFIAPLRGRVFRMGISGNHRAASRHALAHPAVLDAQIAGDALRLVLRAGAAAPAAAELGGDTMAEVEPRFEDGFIALLDERSAVPRRSIPVPVSASISADGPAIDVRALSRQFGRFVAVDQVSFSVGRGEIFGLLGPNGAGKSTMFRMLCGLLRPTSGTARVAGQDLLRAPAAARGRIGYMAQRFSLYGELSVQENLRFFARVYGLGPGARREAIDAALTRFDLAEVAEQTAGLLPLGLKQRLALAAALLHGPEILFLDEPTSGVDPLIRRDFWTRIGGLADAGVTVLVTSHFMDEAEYCDRLGIVSDGRLVAVDTPAGLRARVRTPDLPEPTLEDAFIELVLQARRAQTHDDAAAA